MLTLPAAFESHLQGDALSLTVCWAVTRNDGAVVRGTAHDRDITITTGTHVGTYKARSAVYSTDTQSKSDGSVSNVDVEGAFRVDATTDEMKVTDIEGGLYDQAPAVLFLLNWQAPDDGQRILVSGTLGEFTRDSDGRYRSEVRGLAQALSQQIVQTYSRMCNVRVFGDSRCKFDVPSATRTGTVTAVTSRRRFDAQLDPGALPPSPVYFNGGRLLFTTGDNSGVVREVRVSAVDTGDDSVEILLWDEAPADIAISDTFELPPGCDRQEPTCRLIHNNLVNYRGYGLYASGRDALARGPNEASSSSGGNPWGAVTQAELDERLAAAHAELIQLL